jgi:Ca2+-binding RTX toxin-like protein
VGLLRACAVLAAVPAVWLVPAATASAADSPAPTCAEGPVRVGDTIEGTPCADRIVAPASVSKVVGGGGDDTIIGANSGPVAAVSGSCETGCHLEVGSQTFEGGPGNDIVYGDRGNDTLRGNGGNDRLYGGIGDDVLEGGEGDDWLSGGFGADRIDGQEGSDYVRGDGTIDHIFDTGLAGTDTLCYSTGITPGFGDGVNKQPPYPDFSEVTGFPAAGGERGVYLDLRAGGENGDDGIAASGGGVDEVQPGAFERVIGTPFSDYIVGTGAGEEIIGGGGADVIKGGGGADSLRGGADGDYLEGAAGATLLGEAGTDNCAGGGSASGCEGSKDEVHTRDTTKVSVGETTGPSGSTQVYLVGSSGSDDVTATYEGGAVGFNLSTGSFDESAGDAGGCTLPNVANPTTASCPLGVPATSNVPALDAILLAGMAGNDRINATNFPDGVGVVEIGGLGEDHLNGGAGEDVLVDGADGSRDFLSAGGGDDALIHNDGADVLNGGEGSDLFLSVALCKGEKIEGGAIRAGDRDNASWARLGGVGVDARLDQGLAGEVGPNEQPRCAGDKFDTLLGIEDLEGSNQNDVLYGDGGNNQLLGHKGEDTYFALGGQDSILANSGTRDRIIDCGEGLDTAIIDLASVGDPTPIECESVREGAPEEFKEIPLLSEPPPVPAPVAPPKPDRRSPRTKLTHHPAHVLVEPRHGRRQISFRFTSSEPRSSFRCKLDRKPYRPCRSPRAYRIGPGAHAFRVFAIDAAGNRDPTPALFRFRARRR